VQGATEIDRGPVGVVLIRDPNGRMPHQDTPGDQWHAGRRHQRIERGPPQAVGIRAPAQGIPLVHPPLPLRPRRHGYPGGWLHLAHGVRGTAAGLRSVLYAFMTALDDLSRLIHEPGGYLLAPCGEARVGDVANAAFSCGWVARADGRLFIYYASSDTRCHVATTTVEKLVDYCRKTPPDPLRSFACVQQRIELIAHNLQIGPEAAGGRGSQTRHTGNSANA